MSIIIDNKKDNSYEFLDPTVTISQIPQEVLQQIFSFLPICKKAKTVRVCHEWKSLILNDMRQEESIYIKSLNINIDFADPNGFHHNAIFSVFIYKRIEREVKEVKDRATQDQGIISIVEQLVVSGNIAGAQELAQKMASKEALAEICEVFISYGQLEAAYALTKNFKRDNILEVSYLNKLLLNISCVYLFRDDVKQAEKVMSEIPTSSYRSHIKKAISAYQKI